MAQQALDAGCAEGGAGKKVGRPAGGARSGACPCGRGSRTQRAAERLWADPGCTAGSWRYQRRERNEAALRARLRELAAARPRFGYRRLYIFLRREKTEDGALRWRVNHKKVYRLYREEGLAMQRRRRKRFRAEARVPLALPTRANEVWTMDYTHDPARGRKFRTLNLMDGYTQKPFEIDPDTSLPTVCGWCGYWMPLRRTTRNTGPRSR